MDYDVFNGDADGICALLQLRLSEPRDSVLVTGVKRDINLLKQVQASEGDRVTVLDVSMAKNAEDLERVLSQGAKVFYADHHQPGAIPDHPNLMAKIDQDPNIAFKIARFAFEDEDWSLSLKFLNFAKEYGWNETKGRLELLSGISLYELGRLEESMLAFKEAYKSDETKVAAEGWISFVEEVVNNS